MPKQIRGPKSGYLFDEKQKYREIVWKAFSDHFNDEVSKYRAVFLPSREGAEIPIALDFGFREENLIAVDDNPAVIATAKWRERYPKIKCYGSEVGRAFKRMADEKIYVGAANLDLCGNFGEPLFDTVSAIRDSGALGDGGIVSLTCLKGRETPQFTTLLKRLLPEFYHKRDNAFPARLAVPLMEMSEYIKEIVYGEYRSQTQVMMYGIAGVYSHTNVRETWERESLSIVKETGLLKEYDLVLYFKRHPSSRIVARSRQRYYLFLETVREPFRDLSQRMSEFCSAKQAFYGNWSHCTKACQALSADGIVARDRYRTRAEWKKDQAEFFGS